MTKIITVDDVLRWAEEMAGKKFIIPNELRAAISRGLLEMKEASEQKDVKGIR